MPQKVTMEEREELDFCLVKKRTSYFSKVMQSSKPAKEKSGVRKLEIKFMFFKKIVPLSYYFF